MTEPDLADVARRIEPAARFLPERSLRRAIRLDRDGAGLEARAVHAFGHWIDRDRLFDLLTPAELGLETKESSTQLLLLPSPREGLETNLRDLWRHLFHLAIDREIDRALADGRLTDTAIERLRHRLGAAQWHELRGALEAEHLLADEDPDRHLFREFVAFALELKHFDPDHLEVHFPGLRNLDDAVRLATELFDVGTLLEKTRPAGMGDSLEAPGPPVRVEWPSGPTSDALGCQAADWSRKGNDLKAAVDLYRAGSAEAATYIDRFATRFGDVLEFDPAEREAWRQAFRDLVPAASAGGWPTERRLLYEVQRACLAAERETYAADLVEWLISFGRRPIKRRLTKPKWLDVVRRLRAALHRADVIGSALIEPLTQAIHAAESRARTELRPDLVAVLDDVGLVPRNVPERLSRDKLVEELLDGACDRGFLRIGDLRDAIARNRVKLPDLAGPGEFIAGDPLLQANSKLATRLDGVYRRGEIYMRGLQRGCSLFFGTRVGRAFTKFVALPVGGAYVLIEAVGHMVEAVEGLTHWLTGWTATTKALGAVGGGMAKTLADNPTLKPGGMNLYLLASVSVLLLLLIHWPAFRKRVLHLAAFAMFKLPRAIRRSPTLRAIVHNPVTRFIRRHLLFPVVIGGLSALATWLFWRDGLAATLVGVGLGILAATLFRTPVGRGLEDRLNEVAERVWRIVSVNFLLGLLTLILSFFRAILEAIDRAIYAVDEGLRFHEGESRAAFAFKVGFGLVWFVFTYVFRFAWNLLVEPQINPIKHFPVVTVSHKILVPLAPSLATQLGTSERTMFLLISGVPGIFGFLVWELKENWKLYRANAPDSLNPVIIGSHGEKMRALLRPGFHSGVVPKTFAKWSRAVRARKPHRAAKAHHALEHVAEALHRLVEREFIAYLRVSRRWAGRSIHAEHPRLATNRVRLPLSATGFAGEVILSFEERGGWVIASVEEPGWLAELSADERAAFADALLGLEKLAGTHAVREQVATVIGPEAARFDAVPEGLVIPRPDGTEALFDYDDGPELRSPTRRLASKQMVLSDCPLPWSDWVERWEADAAGKSPREPLLPGWTVLPV